MLRTATLAALLLAMLVTGAQAFDNKRYASVNNIKCDDPETISDFTYIWKRMKNARGQYIVGINGQIQIQSSTEQSRSANKLKCVVVASSDTSNGYKVRGLFIISTFPNHRFRIDYSPNY